MINMRQRKRRSMVGNKTLKIVTTLEHNEDSVRFVVGERFIF